MHCDAARLGRVCEGLRFESEAGGAEALGGRECWCFTTQFAEEIIEVTALPPFQNGTDFWDGAGVGDDGDVLRLQVRFGEAVRAVD